METVSRSATASVIKTYITLTKPGIIMGNIVTATAGFLLASKGEINLSLLILTLIGLACIIASACVFNNYIDRHLDQKMVRTQNRPLARQSISVQNALVYAACLCLAGTFLLIRWANILTAAVALLGLMIYVLIYSFSKYRTSYATLIGSFAGAIPPIVGSCAVMNRLDTGALILFAMIVFWQMPHFFAIAIYRLDDYAAASLPMLPLEKGIRTTKIHMLFYITIFTASALLLPIYGYTGKAYAIVAALLGCTWLGLCLRGLKCENDQAWARQMFVFSLVVVMAICIAIPFSL